MSLPRRCRQALRPLALTALVAAPAARAAPLDPGATITPDGVSGGAGTELGSFDATFFFDGVQGDVFWRVTDDSFVPDGIDPSLLLRFSYEIYSDAGSPAGDPITSVELGDFSGVDIDLVFNPSCSGEVVPTSATRSGDGATVTLEFSGANEIAPDVVTRCIYLRTDGAGFDEDGSIVLRSAMGHTTTLSGPQPAPEPAAVGLGALAGLALLTRRRARAARG